MFISVDVGGTNTRVASLHSLENLAFDETVARRINTHDYDNDMGFIVDEALKLAHGQPIEAVGIGVPGKLNPDKTKIEYAHNIQSWTNQPITSYLSERLGCPVFMDNDAVAMGLGEAHFGETVGDFDYIIWGTGIGGATIRREDGSISVVDRDWEKYFKAWELQNGGNVLASEFGKPTLEFTDADWAKVAVSMEANLRKYCDSYSPRAVVFGGGLAIKHTDLLKGIGKDLGVHLAVTKFEDDSGLAGGFGLIKRGLSAGFES